ncbi:alpha-N-arabinofuranosidase [Xylanibacter muris]|uniref:non-reducing end alpha-L-arabinofuranosidase n=1 Tax=Xylanibacter muris TaxID=2736290 RepID=A0ABX2ASN2_9BACT|nr:alpha-L-arabinofuranosidase C-terminal domain-containing protein [Xylanibacter muris]NPD93037.1 alpha-N-arabinofuranosidase [Xylanibacter muris]
MRKLFISSAFILSSTLAVSAEEATATINVNQGSQKIYKEIYGQFAEHLGSCIYGGLWVGEDSNIPNIKGYRKDVFEALKNLQIPVLRWPGGCFADEYHWTDGIGPKEKRPKMQNNNWGGTIEDNSFGTHEFLNLCEMLGCEPYISGNVGSGTVEELAKWVEYMTSDGDTPMAKLRRQNGRDKAWKVKFLGVGNESWGCGGNMRPEYYSDLYRRYSVYCRNYDGNRLYKIASGASDYDYNWTKVLMNNIGNRMDGVSLHYYTVTGWSGSKGSAIKFNNDDYYWTIGKCLEIEDVIDRHSKIMDEKDPKKNIGLLVDEWGTWWDEEPGTIQGHLYQQNSMRDAFVAALSLNVFHRHTDRVRMANIAQVVNVLQSMILTDQKGTGHMVLTPTYHVFEMYKGFQEATYLPMSIKCDSIEVRGDNRARKGRKVPALSTSAAKQKDGSVIVSLANVNLDKEQTIKINLDGITAKTVSGKILTCKNITDYNDFEHPEVVKPAVFKGANLKKNTLNVKVPAKSIIVLNVK